MDWFLYVRDLSYKSAKETLFMKHETPTMNLTVM